MCLGRFALRVWHSAGVNTPDFLGMPSDWYPRYSPRPVFRNVVLDVIGLFPRGCCRPSR